MSLRPLHLGLRFVLELVALATLALWGRAHGEGPVRLLLTIGLPALVVAAWSTCTVPGDPARGDGGRVRVPGWVRLAFELTVFALAALALADLGWRREAAGLAAATLAHYALWWRRLRWLLHTA